MLELGVARSKILVGVAVRTVDVRTSRITELCIVCTAAKVNDFL